MAKMPKRRQPMQTLYQDEQGRARFRDNALVQHLLDKGGIDMNALAALPDITNADREQFAQLIGYSLDGFGELGYVSDEAYYAAAKQTHLDPLSPMPPPVEVEALLQAQLERYPHPKKAYRKCTDALSTICGDVDRRPWTSVLSMMTTPYSPATLAGWTAVLYCSHHGQMTFVERDHIVTAILDHASRDDRLIDLWVACIEKDGAYANNKDISTTISDTLAIYSPKMFCLLKPMVSSVGLSWTHAISLYREQALAIDFPSLSDQAHEP